MVLQVLLLVAVFSFTLLISMEMGCLILLLLVKKGSLFLRISDRVERE